VSRTARAAFIITPGALAAVVLTPFAHAQNPDFVPTSEGTVLHFSRAARSRAASRTTEPASIEHVVEKFSNGATRLEGDRVGPLKIGTWKQYHKSGNLLFETPYFGGIQHGVVIQYSDGCRDDKQRNAPTLRTTYRMGVMDGPYVENDCTGPKRAEGFYIDGERAGLWRWYRQSVSQGKETWFVATEGRYRCGRKSGTWRHFDASGKVVSENPESGPAPGTCSQADVDRTDDDGDALVRDFLTRNCGPSRLAQERAWSGLPGLFDCSESAFPTIKPHVRCRSIDGGKICGLRLRPRTKDTAVLGDRG
jgi:hypothetical protein